MNEKNQLVLKDIASKLDITHTVLQEILKWSRFQNLPRLREVLEEELDDLSKKLVYEKTDGQKSMRQVSNEAGVPIPTIQGWWNRWYNLGILEPSQAYKGRLKKICLLKDVGMEMPKVAQRKREPKDKPTAEAKQVDAERD